MARILIVGCGCRGRDLARALGADGHVVRGTTRDARNLAEIESAGAEAVICEPNRLATLTPHLAGVSVLCWLMATAGDEALHGRLLQTLLATLVDTPVRGVVYEGGAGEAIVRRAGETFRMPVAILSEDPVHREPWLAAARDAVAAVLAEP